MADVESPHSGDNGGQWTGAIDQMFHRSFAASRPSQDHSQHAVVQPHWQVSGGRDGTQLAADGGGSPDFEGASMPPLTLPLDLSAAPSLSLPEVATQPDAAEGATRAPQHPLQQQSAAASIQQDPDDGRPAAGSGPNVVGQAGGGQGSSAATSKRTSAEDTPRGSPDRPRTPADAPLTSDDQQQQRMSIDLQYPGLTHLVPVADQRLDTWPPGSRSPKVIRGAAQQLVQWQQQQQQQAGGTGGGGGLPHWQQATESPFERLVRHSIDNGDAARATELQRAQLLSGLAAGRATLPGYLPQQTTIRPRSPGGGGSAAEMSAARQLRYSNESPIQSGTWVQDQQQLDPGLAVGADVAAGMYPMLEQQMAAAASGMTPLMATSGMSPPRSTDMSPPRRGAASTAHYGEGARIYVGGVPDLVSVNMVRSHFSRWGQVEDVYFPKERATRRRRPFCFVTFDSHQAAERAVAESNRVIEGYPVASITVPTERSAHYGLRPPPAGSPTTLGATPLRPTDSVFVQARQAQIAQQAAISQQQQQAVVAQLAAAGVDPAVLQGLSMQPAQLISNPSGATTSVGINSGLTDLMSRPSSGGGAPANVGSGTSSYWGSGHLGTQQWHGVGGGHQRIRSSSIGGGEATRVAAMHAAVAQGMTPKQAYESLAEGAASSEGVRSISAGYGTIARLTEADADAARAAASCAAAGDAPGMPAQPLRRVSGDSAEFDQRLQNLSFNTYSDLAGPPMAAVDLIAHYRSHNVHHDSIQAPSLVQGEMGTFGGFRGVSSAASPVRQQQWASYQRPSGMGASSTDTSMGTYSIFYPHSETGTTSGSVGRPGSERLSHESMYGAGGPTLRGSPSGTFAKQGPIDEGAIGHCAGFDNSNLIEAFRAARIADAAAEQQRQAQLAQQQYDGADDGRFSSAAQQRDEHRGGVGVDGGYGQHLHSYDGRPRSGQASPAPGD